MKGKFFFLAICIFAAPGIWAGEGGHIDINPLIEEGLKNNPEIQAAYNNWQASFHRVKQVKSLPDPMASVSVFGEHIETKLGPQERKYTASQKVPFPGKLDLKGKAQSKHADMLKEKYEAAKQEVAKNIKFAYYDIYWVDRAVQINEEEKSILENLEKAAQRKFESDLAPQQDVIKAQVEISRVIDRLFTLRQRRESLIARINSLLNRREGTQFGKISKAQALPFKYELEALHKFSQESRQELISAKLDIERKEYEESLAKLDYFPDFTLGVDYIEIGGGTTAMQDDGRDAWMGMIAVNLPIWYDRLNSQVKEKKAGLEASKKNFKNMENSVAYEVEDLYFKITTYRDIVSLYETALLPQTEQSFEAARIGYETGKVDFLNWLDAERVLLQTRLAYYKAVVDYMKSIAYLERVVGKQL